jgi:hypothetical protein
MRILYIHQYFKTPAQGGAVRSYHIAKAMVAAGHQVDLITSHNLPEYQITRIEGIRVHYLPVTYDNKLGTLRRLWSFVWFAFKSYRLGKKINPDCVYATSTPLTVAHAGLKLSSKKGIPFYFEVRDLWPLAPQQLGVLPKWLLFWAQKLEKKAYLRADKIVALSPLMKDHVFKFVSREKVMMIPNFSNNTLASQLKPKLTEIHPKPFRITYSGALGLVNDIPFLLGLIKVIHQQFPQQIEFTVFGDGGSAKVIKEACMATKNCHFMGFRSKKEIYKHLLTSDANLTTFLALPALESNSPNKFFDGLACSNISLINFGGWIEELISKHNCGLRLNPTDLANQLQSLIQNPELNRQKANAKQLALHFFDQEKLCKSLVQQLVGVEKPHQQTDKNQYPLNLMINEG